jgi:hypothetical protein
MTETKTETKTLIIQSSPDGENDWANHLAEDVPEWVKTDDQMSKMVAGNMVCFNDTLPYRWWRAVEMSMEELPSAA